MKADGSPMTDYSWRPTNENLTCWQKAHSFYIPNGLFQDVHFPQEDPSAPRFQRLQLSSLVYHRKRIAEGLDAVVKRQSRKKEDTFATADSGTDHATPPDVDVGEKRKIARRRQSRRINNELGPHMSLRRRPSRPSRSTIHEHVTTTAWV